MSLRHNNLLRPEVIQVRGLSIPVFNFNTVVVGTGCAGYNAADTLHSLGQTDVAIVTEGVNMGTSRNTGSDKQTYYKLTLAGEGEDSVRDMARTLFEGGGMHGDIALVEAAMSARCFYKLVNLGVRFPHNRYGEYVGYKTDHDPRQRATSCGPLTSRMMTQQLQKSVESKNIPVFDRCRVVGIVTDTCGGPQNACARKAVGLLAIDADNYDAETRGLVLFNCTNIVYATGGPSALYHASVYPESQTSATGTALEAGVRGINLTESQYGIASVKFRWNLSGTYQQVIPTYVSTDCDGNDAREFLDDAFRTTGDMMNATFLKGYQWPFDPRKLGEGGSSVVDIAVFAETRLKGRRVFLDFRMNPRKGGGANGLNLDLLNAETRAYLEKSGALLDTPINRLKKMNPPAYRLYLDNGIDLEQERLEIAVCAQHNNGGLVGNIWWESNVKHFFPVGEVNGTFGVYRPGGTALNSTQVGSTRAAQFIHANYATPPMPGAELAKLAEPKIGAFLDMAQKLSASKDGKKNPFVLREEYQRTMDACGAFIRPKKKIDAAIAYCRERLLNFAEETRAEGAAELTAACVNRDILLSQFVYLSAIGDYIERGGKSRGSYLICDSIGELGLEVPVRDSGIRASKNLTAVLDEGAFSGVACEAALNPENLTCSFDWQNVRPIPEDGDWFENIYNAYIKDETVR